MAALLARQRLGVRQSSGALTAMRKRPRTAAAPKPRGMHRRLLTLRLQPGVPNRIKTLTNRFNGLAPTVQSLERFKKCGHVVRGFLDGAVAASILPPCFSIRAER